MKTITLQSRPDKFALSFAFIFSAMLFSAVAKDENGQVSITDLIGAIAVGLAVSFAWHWSSNRKMLIDQRGIHITRHILQSFSLPWDEIHSIGTASVCRIEEGLNRGISGHHVGIQLQPWSPLYASKQCRDNRRLSNYDVLIGAVYGMSVPRFAEFLAERKDLLHKPMSREERID
jgi:hypothetical protein